MQEAFPVINRTSVPVKKTDDSILVEWNDTNPNAVVAIMIRFVCSIRATMFPLIMGRWPWSPIQRST